MEPHKHETQAARRLFWESVITLVLGVISTVYGSISGSGMYLVGGIVLIVSGLIEQYIFRKAKRGGSAANAA